MTVVSDENARLLTVNISDHQERTIVRYNDDDDYHGDSPNRWRHDDDDDDDDDDDGNGSRETATATVVARTEPTTTISSCLRWMTNIVTLTSVLCFSGIIFGWAPLKLILVAEGQYHDELCRNSAVVSDQTSSWSSWSSSTTETTTGGTTCAEQMDRFNLMFTLAQFLLGFASLPVGFLLDSISKTQFYLLAAMLEVVGLILFGISDATTTAVTTTTYFDGFRQDDQDDDQDEGTIGRRDYFLPAFCFLALGGAMTYLGSFPVSFLLPEYQTGILASISCLFDASSVVFAFAYSLFHANSIAFSRSHQFVTYAILAIVIYSLLVSCWYRLDRLHWKTVLQGEGQQSAKRRPKIEDDHGTTTATMATTTTSTTTTMTNIHHEDDDDKEGAATSHSSSSPPTDMILERIRRLGMHDLSLGQQLCTVDFAFVLVLISVQVFRCNFYVETVNELLLEIATITTRTTTRTNANGHDDHDHDDHRKNAEDIAADYATIFSFVLPSGIVFVPLIDVTLRQWGIIRTLHLTNALGVLIGLMLLIPSLPVQAVTFGLFACFRAYLYASLNAFVALSFGVSTMGRIMGIAFTTAAMVTLLQYPAAAWAEQSQEQGEGGGGGGGGGGFRKVNTVMLLLCLIPIVITVLYERWTYHYMKSKEEEKCHQGYPVDTVEGMSDEYDRPEEGEGEHRPLLAGGQYPRQSTELAHACQQ